MNVRSSQSFSHPVLPLQHDSRFVSHDVRDLGVSVEQTVGLPEFSTRSIEVLDSATKLPISSDSNLERAFLKAAGFVFEDCDKTGANLTTPTELLLSRLLSTRCTVDGCFKFDLVRETPGAVRTVRSRPSYLSLIHISEPTRPY